MDYLGVLRNLHEFLAPDVYLEIGVEHGHSLAIARGKSIGVDPAPAVTAAAAADKPWLKLYRATSDAFFADRDRDATLEGGHLGLVMIDGLHLFEQVLRDFINVERWTTPASVIVVHDVIPPEVASASRAYPPTTFYWVGDVWKMVPCLTRFRPDLMTQLVAAPPSGMLVIRGADPTNTVLSRRYDEIVAEYAANDDDWERAVSAFLAGIDPIDPAAFLRGLLIGAGGR